VPPLSRDTANHLLSLAGESMADVLGSQATVVVVANEPNATRVVIETAASGPPLMFIEHGDQLNVRAFADAIAGAMLRRVHGARAPEERSVWRTMRKSLRERLLADAGVEQWLQVDLRRRSAETRRIRHHPANDRFDDDDDRTVSYYLTSPLFWDELARLTSDREGPRGGDLVVDLIRAALQAESTGTSLAWADILEAARPGAGTVRAWEALTLAKHGADTRADCVRRHVVGFGHASGA